MAAGRIGQQAKWVQALRKEGVLLGQDSVAAYGKLNDVGLGARCGRGAVLPSLVEHIKEATSGEEDGSFRVGAAGSDGKTVNRAQPSGVVVDFETADDALTVGSGSSGGLCSGYIQESDRVTLDARRNAEQSASREGAHQEGLAEFPKLHAIPSSWSGVRRQVRRSAAELGWDGSLMNCKSPG